MFCPQCGSQVADDQRFCQECGTRLREEIIPGEAASFEQSTPLAEFAPSASGKKKTPWEDRDAQGFFGGLFKTLNEVLFRPSEFYKKMPIAGGLTDPLLYALIVGMAGFMFSYLWQTVTQGAMQGMMPGMVPGMHTSGGQNMLHGIGLALLAFFSPFLIIMGLFITSGILHVCLMMIKGTKYGFETTFRVVAYGYSANIFMVIPFCGSLLAAVWALILYIIGLKEAHETTGGRAAFAVFLPAIVCCGFFLFVMAIFLGAAAGSLGLMMQK